MHLSQLRKSDLFPGFKALSGLAERLDPGTANDAFSRANVFGLFLTIAFCLLVQPRGSLLYVLPRKITGRYIFFFWRLNPLACIMEVLLVVVALVDSIRFATIQSLSSPSSKLLNFWKSLRISVTATYLLRSCGKPSDAQWFVAEEDEQADDDSDSDFLDSSECSLLLNSFGHADIALNLVGSVSTLVVVIKLSSVLLPMHTRLPALFMIASWFSVQTLLLLSMSHVDDMDAMSRRAVDIGHLVNHLAVWISLTISLLPLFGYLTFEFLHKSLLLPEFVGIIVVVLPVLSVFRLSGFLKSRFLTRLSVANFSDDVSSWVCQKPALAKFKIGAFIIVDLVLRAGEQVAYQGLAWGYARSAQACRKEDHPAARNYILPYLIFPSTLWYLIFLPAIPSVPWHHRIPESRRCIALLSNLIVVAAVFAATILWYDEHKSRKPGWLDWLGKT